MFRSGSHVPSRTLSSLALSGVLVLAIGALILSAATGALAASGSPSSPLITGPGEAIAPPPPKLPGQKPGGDRSRPAPNDKGTAGAGAAIELLASCAPFGHTQTYSAWGPAVAYGQPVTIVYQADRCSTPNGSALDVSAEGTASVHQGETAAGALIDTRPFTVTGTWREPQNAVAWPPTWWGCDVPFASYTWEIPDVYTFEVSANDGFWTLDVNSHGVGDQAVAWTHDGCA